MSDYAALPPDLPVPEDDGAADHLPGLPVPELELPSTQGGKLDLSSRAANRLVAYLYPRTGVPGTPFPKAGTTSPELAAARHRAAPTATRWPSSTGSAPP